MIMILLIQNEDFNYFHINSIQDILQYHQLSFNLFLNPQYLLNLVYLLN